jgi:hypothetical protein
LEELKKSKRKCELKNIASAAAAAAAAAADALLGFHS